MTQKEQLEIGLGRKVPPSRIFVTIYFIQKGLNEQQADFFYLKYELVGWCDSKGSPLRNWKTLASEWIWNLKHNS
ncbi:hypothetical protein BFS30_24265 [Pedobacter steynii]|uniref:Uncharacterized protein n=1 Tax=Pedobacter steynii TaxID=430522 RepID=A0A1D7QMZ2_9SPHI|nr:hypothetical protein BFS30_24265 [Pedobacter steynii]